MDIFDLLKMVLGLSLFLFGMNTMGDALRNMAGTGLRGVLERFTARRAQGVFFGALVTALIQSSSATTVMVVGFVNSGIMELSQAVGVIMGANVGTAFTSWITALSALEGGAAVGSLLQWFKPSSFTPILALVGIIIYNAGKWSKSRDISLIFLGFSVLMLGMDTMSDSVKGLSENEGFRSILLALENPVLGVLGGLIITAIVQSSSASIGILQSFTSTGAITFGNAVPIIMGQNIGTCITALIASVGVNKNAKRASVIHLLFNLFGSVIGLGVFYVIKKLLRSDILESGIDMWGIAATHTAFNFLTAIILFPVSHMLQKCASLIIKDGTDNKGK